MDLRNEVQEMLEGLSVDELKGVANYVKAELAEKREEIKANAKAEAEARAEETAQLIGNSEITTGTVINFLYKRETVKGEVVKVNEKSLTVRSDAFAGNKTDKNYVLFKNVIGVA